MRPPQAVVEDGHRATIAPCVQDPKPCLGTTGVPRRKRAPLNPVATGESALLTHVLNDT